MSFAENFTRLFSGKKSPFSIKNTALCEIPSHANNDQDRPYAIKKSLPHRVVEQAAIHYPRIRNFWLLSLSTYPEMFGFYHCQCIPKCLHLSLSTYPEIFGFDHCQRIPKCLTFITVNVSLILLWSDSIISIEAISGFEHICRIMLNHITR